jgi:hypothetical protein
VLMLLLRSCKPFRYRKLERGDESAALGLSCSFCREVLKAAGQTAFGVTQVRVQGMRSSRSIGIGSPVFSQMPNRSGSS